MSYEFFQIGDHLEFHLQINKIYVSIKGTVVRHPTAKDKFWTIRPDKDLGSDTILINSASPNLVLVRKIKSDLEKAQDEAEPVGFEF